MPVAHQGRDWCASRLRPAHQSVLVCCALVALSGSGCSYGYQLLATSPRSLLGGSTAVSLRSAWLLPASTWVYATVTNDGRRPLAIDYREWALRGPDGRTFPPRQDKRCCGTPYVLEPGQSQDVQIEFPITGSNAQEWPSVELVVGGVSELPDGSVQVVGTVPLTRSGTRERFDEKQRR